MTPLALAMAVAIIAGWFPFAALWHQQRELDATSAQIAALRHEEQDLKAQRRADDSRSAVVSLAREQYQLVFPGQSLIQVLPSSKAGTLSPEAGDPGFQPLVSPVDARATVASASTTPRGASRGFLTRLVRTLEFWR